MRRADKRLITVKAYCGCSDPAPIWHLCRPGNAVRLGVELCVIAAAQSGQLRHGANVQVQLKVVLQLAGKLSSFFQLTPSIVNEVL